MNLAFRSLKVYLRLVLVATLLVGVGLVFYMNRSNEVRFWFFWIRDETQPVNVIWLMIGTAASALVGWWTLALGWRVFRDWRELKRLREIDERDKFYKGREAELEARERRLEEKANAVAETDVDGDEEDTEGTGPEAEPGEGEAS